MDAQRDEEFQSDFSNQNDSVAQILKKNLIKKGENDAQNVQVYYKTLQRTGSEIAQNLVQRAINDQQNCAGVIQINPQYKGPVPKKPVNEIPFDTWHQAYAKLNVLESGTSLHCLEVNDEMTKENVLQPHDSYLDAAIASTSQNMNAFEAFDAHLPVSQTSMPSTSHTFEESLCLGDIFNFAPTSNPSISPIFEASDRLGELFPFNIDFSIAPTDNFDETDVITKTSNDDQTLCTASPTFTRAPSSRGLYRRSSVVPTTELSKRVRDFIASEIDEANSKAAKKRRQSAESSFTDRRDNSDSTEANFKTARKRRQSVAAMGSSTDYGKDNSDSTAANFKAARKRRQSVATRSICPDCGKEYSDSYINKHVCMKRTIDVETIPFHEPEEARQDEIIGIADEIEQPPQKQPRIDNVIQTSNVAQQENQPLAQADDNENEQDTVIETFDENEQNTEEAQDGESILDEEIGSSDDQEEESFVSIIGRPPTPYMINLSSHQMKLRSKGNSTQEPSTSKKANT